MGRVNGPYKEDYPVGTRVQILGLEELEQFKQNWKYHHKLEEFQLSFAGWEAEVASIGFYHGGDELYQLVDIPGIWHEECLRQV